MLRWRGMEALLCWLAPERASYTFDDFTFVLPPSPPPCDRVTPPLPLTPTVSRRSHVGSSVCVPLLASLRSRTESANGAAVSGSTATTRAPL